MALRKILNRYFQKRDDLSGSDWEIQYKSGRWRYLNQLQELAHYSVIIGYIKYFQHNGAILDVGCGEGVLFDLMCPCTYSRYVGIDISQTALDHASKKGNEKSLFVRSPLEEYSPDEKFDAIVFNEVLYYFKRPAKVLEHYRDFLNADGVFIVSMYRAQRNDRLWKTWESIYPPLDETKLANGYKTSWICKVYRST